MYVWGLVDGSGETARQLDVALPRLHRTVQVQVTLCVSMTNSYTAFLPYFD